jgi:NAD+ synthase
MQHEKIIIHIVEWLKTYALNSKQKGYIVGISGGIDSAVTSTLCAMTNLEILIVSLPLRQRREEYNRALAHIENLKSDYYNVKSMDIDLSSVFKSLQNSLPEDTVSNKLAMANTRSRLRMTTLYALGQANGLLVAGTGNKIEDFGVGFFTKYGDGGVDVSPIADLTKTQVRLLAKELGIQTEIIDAAPTDGLWDEDRTDEIQMGASYPELEWAMEFQGDETKLSTREKEVLGIYRRLNKANQHKMIPIPVCNIPKDLY